MKYVPLTLLLFLSLSGFSQQTVYQVFEVDSAAQPRGGIPFFNTFLLANLRKPITAQAVGVGGRVIVSGIVETDGSVSDVNVAIKLSPDLDREAVRVFSLFNAWKPAQKNGQAVRQKITFPILFQPNKPFVYANGQRVSYYDEENSPASDSSTRTRYKQIVPIDNNGVPTGDMIVYERRNKSWKESSRLALKRHKNSPSPYREPTYTIGIQDANNEWYGEIFLVNEAGTILRRSTFFQGKRIGPELSYYPNGCVSEKNEESGDKSSITSWHSNGQVKQIKTSSKPKPLSPEEPEVVTAYWDSTGHPEVIDGSGYATFRTEIPSYKDTTRYTLLTERGQYVNGLKQGIWTGRYADGSYFYEETYDKGICQGGKAKGGQADTIRYTTVSQQPEFAGGMQGLGRFLSQNLSYPATAQKTGAQGRVHISFVVCTDGTLCDYEVLKGVQRDLDQEALRVVKQMSGKWKPGSLRGEKVRVKYNMPINFTLN